MTSNTSTILDFFRLFSSTPTPHLHTHTQLLHTTYLHYPTRYLGGDILLSLAQQPPVIMPPPPPPSRPRPIIMECKAFAIEIELQARARHSNQLVEDVDLAVTFPEENKQLVGCR